VTRNGTREATVVACHHHVSYVVPNGMAQDGVCAHGFACPRAPDDEGNPMSTLTAAVDLGPVPAGVPVARRLVLDLLGAWTAHTTRVTPRSS
jgi:hypothetical protein